MNILDTLAKVNLLGLDPSRGVLVFTAYWRPQPSDPNPEQPGERAIITSYLRTNAGDLCPCGSGKHFGACCQSLPYWQPVCPNPGMHAGYSLLVPQSATFTNTSGDEIYDFLQDDQRLYCVEDTKQRMYWTYWGVPALKTPSGIVSFGDIELIKNRTLLMTAISDVRMNTLLDVISPLNLGTPQIQREHIIRLEKPVRKPVRGKRQRKR